MIEVKKEKLDELRIFPFDLTPTELNENDQLIVAGHPVIDGVQQKLQLSFHRCKKKLGKENNGKLICVNYTICI